MRKLANILSLTMLGTVALAIWASCTASQQSATFADDSTPAVATQPVSTSQPAGDGHATSGAVQKTIAEQSGQGNISAPISAPISVTSYLSITAAALAAIALFLEKSQQLWDRWLDYRLEKVRVVSAERLRVLGQTPDDKG